MRLRKTFLLAAAVGALSALPAGANTITPSFVSVAGAGPFTWTYTASLDSGRLDPALGTQFFTIYDINGYVDSSETAPVGWVASHQLVGTTPTLTAPTDLPGFMNVTFTYVGAPISDAPLGGTVNLGNFTFMSTSGLSQPNASFWSSQDTKYDTTTPGDNTPQKAIGQLTGPTPPEITTVPEPGSMMLLGSGLLGLAGAVRRRLGR